MTGDRDRTYDALVIGAGVIGLSCAWRLAERGLSVAVIERDQPGSGATGLAAGMLAPVGEATWGEENLLELALASARAWPAFSEDLEEASGKRSTYRRLGALHVGLDRDEAEALRRRYELHLRLGLDSQWLRGSEARRVEPGIAASCTAGLFAKGEAAVDAQALLSALAAAAERSGVEIFPGVEARKPLIEGGSLRGVGAAGGRTFIAESIVLATGCWSGTLDWLPAEALPPIRPVKGEILTMRGSTAEPVCERIVAGERVYMVPREDGRLIVGATVEEKGFDLTVTAGGVHELLREAYRALPDIAELELVQASAGLRPGTPDNAPVIGATALEGLLLASGHYRNGVLLAPVTADAVASMVAGEEPAVPVDAFRPDRFKPGGEPAPGEVESPPDQRRQAVVP